MFFQRAVVGGVTAVAVVALAACGSGRTADPADCPALTAAAMEADGPLGTFEEASLVALGELFRIYPDGRPMPVEVTGDTVEVEGAAVWRLEGDYEVTIDERVRAERWVLWVGSDGTDLRVLCAYGPSGWSGTR